jgi:hypothetical protein
MSSQSNGAPVKARVLRALKMAAYVCGNGHRFAIDTETEPPSQYVVVCPACRDDTRIEEDR